MAYDVFISLMGRIGRCCLRNDLNMGRYVLGINCVNVIGVTCLQNNRSLQLVVV